MENGNLRHSVLLQKSEPFTSKEENTVSYKIFTDSACDIKNEVLNEWGVDALDLSFRFVGENTMYKNSDMTTEEFYKKMREGGVAKTSAVNPDAFTEAFEKELKAGNDVIYIAFSSGLSTTYNSARIAKEALSEKYPDRKIEVIDTLAASAGEGLIVYLAAKRRDEGATAKELAEYVESIKLGISIWFTVDDLVYLKRGGRVSPLTAMVGNLVGINTAIISQTGSYAGYSFAVPSNMVKKIAYDLMDFGSVKRAVLGVVMQPIDDKIAGELKLSSRNGVYINEVSKGSAADMAGVKAGDVLVAIDSVKITNPASVQETVSRFSPGDKATVTVIRDGKTKEMEVEFKGTSQENGTLSDDGSVAFYGSSIRSASEETLARYGLKNGVEIVELGPGKLKEAGAQEGFIIQYVNEHQVKTPQDVIDVVKKSKRTVFIEGVTPSGRIGYFGFGL